MNLETARRQLAQLPGEVLWPEDTTITPEAIQALVEADELREAMPGVYVKTHRIGVWGGMPRTSVRGGLASGMLK